jgi:hypothetical protein
MYTMQMQCRNTVVSLPFATSTAAESRAMLSPNGWLELHKIASFSVSAYAKCNDKALKEISIAKHSPW